MQALVLYFVDLCLLRRGPQDLPAYPVLLAVTLGVDLAVGMVLAVVGTLSAWQGLLRGAVDVFLMLVLLRVALELTGRAARFTQAATALLGSGAVIGAAALLPLAMLSGAEEASAVSPLAVLLMLGLIAWSVLVTGHILRHAFQIRLGQGAAVAIIYQLTAYSIVGALFGGA